MRETDVQEPPSWDGFIMEISYLHQQFRTKPNLKHTSASLRFEKAAVVFNVGAASSRIAAAVDRAAEGGVKEACGEFQRAAGAFRAVGQMMEGGEGTVDMSPEAAAMLERLMLAQAQECCFERALAAGTSPAACSKVARQEPDPYQGVVSGCRGGRRDGVEEGVVAGMWGEGEVGNLLANWLLQTEFKTPTESESLPYAIKAALYYEEAYAALVIPPLQNHFERSWLSHVQLKAAQFNAEACYRYAIELHDKMEIGEEIARLQFGINAVVDAKRTARGAPASLYDSVSRLEQDMNQNLEKAVNENNRIYLMRIPAAKLLSPLPSASLVRSASKSEVLDAKAETGL
ncbi:unnamed protein product [Triticum turgidum subsp. durum]|uniref:BRO1 domain-containing protein n=1 Tax=Triticum turgidum subsp. durum TaxID=4567 RepID=A0A9R0Y2X6_TRITD|nr:unnamed protein product [Triticum turgidum subsp. durum]